MQVYKSFWFWVVLVFFLVIIAGSIYHKCQIDSLKENNNKILQQLLEDSNWQTKKLDETVSAIRTVESSQISSETLSKELEKQLAKLNLSAIYGAQVDLRTTLNKVLEGQSGIMTIVERPSTQPNTSNPTTVIIRERENNANNSSNSNNSNGNPSCNTQPPPASINTCNECLASNIIRVPFSRQEGFLSVEGYTETAPAIGESGTYQLNVSWLKDISLSIALAQAEDGSWTTLINSNDPDVNIERIRSEVNISPFETHWYQKFQLGFSLAFGETGALGSVLLGYKITDHINLLGSLFYTLPYSDDTLDINDYNENAYYGLVLLGNF